MPNNSSPSQTNPSNTAAYQQIAQNANYYSPAVYFQFLSQLTQSLVLQSDPMGAAFIPVSDAMYNPDQRKKLFVVGLIPPSALPTGRTLDRSSNGTGPATAMTSGQPSSQTTVPGVQGANQGPPVYNKLTPQQAAAAILLAYQQKYQRDPTQQELAMYVAQSQTETSLKWPSYNPGFIGNYTANSPTLNNQNTFQVKVNGQTRYFNAYDSAQAGASSFINYIQLFGGPQAQAAAQAGDATAYCQALRGYMGTSDAEVNAYANLIGQIQPGLVNQIGNPSNLDTGALLSSLSPISYGPNGQIDPSTSTAWASTGGVASAQAGTQLAASQNTNLQNATNTATTYAQAQRAMALATQQLITQMAQTPPLQFLVNPSSFKVNNEKVIADGSWTRLGPQDVVEHWGDNQDKIEGSGKVAAFQAIDTTTDTTGPGVTRTARQYSLSYQNFLSLYQIYRNNAGIYLPSSDELGGGPTNLSVLGSVYIYFDYTMYVGSFDNFTVTETDSEPYTLEYSFSFTARATFIFDQVADPNFTYNIPAGGFTVQQPPVIASASIQAAAPGTINNPVDLDAAPGTIGNPVDLDGTPSIQPNFDTGIANVGAGGLTLSGTGSKV